MGHKQAKGGTAPDRRAGLHKEERNKWGLLPAPLKVDFGRQGETVYAGNSLLAYSTSAYFSTRIND